jgi:excisionase family DNA binding protein
MKTKTLSTTPGYLRRAGAAKYLGVSLRTIGDMQARRQIPFSRLSARCILFRVTDLDEAVRRFRVNCIGEEAML